MNDFAIRKRLLAARADLHRELVRLEYARWHDRLNDADSFTRNNRWWLMGGTVVVGVLLARNWQKLISWLPTVSTVWRMLK